MHAQGKSPQRSQRERSETPEMMRQNQRPPDEQPDDKRPEPQDQSQNQAAETVRDDATEEIKHGRDGLRWGQLPEYMELLKTRGAQPGVPEKYRKFRDEYLKRAQKEKARKN